MAGEEKTASNAYVAGQLIAAAAFLEQDRLNILLSAQDAPWLREAAQRLIDYQVKGEYS